MLKVWLLEEVRQSWLQPLMKWIWEEMAYEDIEDSSDWNGYILLILSIGMSYYKGGAIRIIDKSQVLKLTKLKC
jgi:hypothetical protein